MSQKKIFDKVEKNKTEQDKTVLCLGKTFESEEKRREYFVEELRQILKDPEFRKTEGFPIGEDDDILELSDPPYYTACPNPWTNDFIEQWEAEKPEKEEDYHYHREPFATDVSEGKNNPIYNAHSYHTKVPHKAIMRYILHYTEPGDIVFDGFCGTGMTGVAAQMCGNKSEVESLGYKVTDDGSIMQEEIDENGQKKWQSFSKIGARKAVLNDLSPAATFIAYNYNTPVDAEAFEKEAQKVLDEVEEECGWMYETYHTTGEGFLAAKQIYDKWKDKGVIQHLSLKTKKDTTLTKEEKNSIMTKLQTAENETNHLFSFSITDNTLHLLSCTKEKVVFVKLLKSSEFQIDIQRDIEDDKDFHNTLSHIYYQPIKSKLCSDSKSYDWYFIDDKIEENGWIPASIAKINYYVWSDVFVCPECSQEIVFWEEAVNHQDKVLRNEITCPHCGALNTKKQLERIFESKYDSELKCKISQVKQSSVLNNYSFLVEGKKNRNEKTPDFFDNALIKKIENTEFDLNMYTIRFMEGTETRRNDKFGITHLHHFFTRRNFICLSFIFKKIAESTLSIEYKSSLKHLITSIMINLDKRYVWRINGKGGIVKGTMYLPSFSQENMLHKSFKNKFSAFLKYIKHKKTFSQKNFVLSNDSLTQKSINNKLDYIFLDPPFGANLNYSELNFIWESWLKVWTNNKPEAIQNKVQNKGLDEYRQLMTECFKEAYRILKPGRWMTVEFSNTKATVWNGIQTAITDAGFIIANTSALDKQQGSFKAVTTSTAVKQDLIISTYKPNGGFEDRFIQEAQSEDGVWDFIRTHMKYLPIVKKNKGIMEFISERDPRLLYDQVVAYFVRKGYAIPISSQAFQNGLAQRFAQRDGMFFLTEQVSEYDKTKILSKEFKQTSIFVSDEATAIDWLRNLLKQKPQTFSEINPLFMQQLGGWEKNEKELDLRDLLNENFLCYEGNGQVPNQIHSYLSTNWKDLRKLPKDDPKLVQKAKDRWYVPDPNKSGDLEKMREKSLLKEFEEYKNIAKKLKLFRIEAVRVGFKKAWQERDYQTIITIAEKIPSAVLEKDAKLLMWYDQAITKTGG
jgi:DNA modification methylase